MTGIPSIEEIKAMIFQLPIEDQIALVAELEEKIQTISRLQLTSTQLHDWNESEEDIYEDIYSEQD